MDLRRIGLILYIGLLGWAPWQTTEAANETAPAGVSPSTTETGLRDAVSRLNTNDFAQKLEAAGEITGIDHVRAPIILNALVNGELNTLSADKSVVVVATRTDDGYDLEDAITGQALEPVGKRGVRKIAVNNQLRTAVREILAMRSLSAPDPLRRLAAVKDMFGALDDSAADILKSVLLNESDPHVKSAIHDALALLDLQDGTEDQRSQAIDHLSENVSGVVRTALLTLSEDDTLSPGLREKARQSIAAIEETLRVYHMVEIVFFGLSLGSVLALAAIGLAITFGVMGVINMAHGEMIMLGAYTTYVVQILMPDAISYSLFVAIPAAFLVSGLVGIAIERGVIRFLYGRPLETLLATFGLSLVLQQLVRSIFSPLNRSVITPDWMSGSLELIAGLSFTYNRLYILMFSLVVFFALLAVLNKTRLGLEVRAVAQNRAMARAVGVRTAW
ncbi:MAG: urea ABC transporter permease subunit UrtB, partial [Proteobacteria bacterium]|nr:urea ABC transporter permease subunit UrtB [Pseudomonadota bacterium]